MKKLVILGMMVVGMMSFADDSDKFNRVEASSLNKIESSANYDNDYFMEMSSKLEDHQVNRF